MEFYTFSALNQRNSLHPSRVVWEPGEHPVTF